MGVSEAGFAAPEEVILFLFVQQRGGSCGVRAGGGCKSDTGPRQAEPPGSNPILARYTLSPVNHNSVLGAAAPAPALSLPPEPGMKPLRRTSARAQAPLSSSSSRRPRTPPKDARRGTTSGYNFAPRVILAPPFGGQPTGDKTGGPGVQHLCIFLEGAVNCFNKMRSD